MKVEHIYISCNDHKCVNYWEGMCTPTVSAKEEQEFDIIPQTCKDLICKTETCSTCIELGESKCPLFEEGVSEWYEEIK